MSKDYGIYTITDKEERIKQLLSEGNLQSDIAKILNVSRPYINQITQRLRSYNLIVKSNIQNKDKITIVFKESIISKSICELNVNLKYIKPIKKYSNKKCPICNNPTPINNRTNKPLVYCCKDCKKTAKLKIENYIWDPKRGNRRKYCHKFNNNLKLRVRAFFNYVCFACGEPEGKIALNIHHVLYNPMACCKSGGKALLIPLCTSCHNRTNHKKDRDFWEQLFYIQLMERTGGKCFFTKREWRGRPWS